MIWLPTKLFTFHCLVGYCILIFLVSELEIKFIAAVCTLLLYCSGDRPELSSSGSRG